jgi:hypothetical protein
MVEIKKSTRKNNKYMVKTPSDKWIHFGQRTAQHFKDSTGLGLYSHLDHGDKKRRASYLARAKGIKNKQGKLTWKNKESSNYYSIKFLWT